MKEYEVYLPVAYNDGTPIDAGEFELIGELLLAEFGGVTFFPQRNQGMWKMGPVIFKDHIVIFRVLTDKVLKARKFFRGLKEKLKETFEQKKC
ncbi:MAG: hypothetical protein U0793_31745 [Gemmataceae bacterium]